MFKKFLIRSLVIACWIGLIFCFLYWPKWKFFHYEAGTINVFTWGDVLDPSVITAFEKETGIKVNLNFYSSNEELLAKLKATRGADYDLIIPSDYAVHFLIQEQLLKAIDKEKLEFLQELNPRLLGHPFDPHNTYSIPFEWEIFGLGFDKPYFQNRPFIPSWKLIFDTSMIPYKITMINDPIEAINFASFYLYGPVQRLSEDALQKVKKLLIDQKKLVVAYASFRGDYYLATKNCTVVLASSSYILRTMRKFPFIGFAVPEEGTFISIENLCIPRPSDKEALTYKFINFLYRKETVAKHYQTFGFFPSTLHALHLLDLPPEMKSLILSSEKDFQKFHFIALPVSEQKIRDLWVQVKSEDN